MLLEQGVVDGAALDGIEAEIGREIEAGLADARQASFPSVESMAADLYAESGGL